MRVAHLAFPPARLAVLRGALIVGAFSALIEVLQKLHGAPEGLGWSAFDVGCGAVGGALGGQRGDIRSAPSSRIVSPLRYPLRQIVSTRSA